MKKISTLALVASLAVASSAFAQTPAATKNNISVFDQNSEVAPAPAHVEKAAHPAHAAKAEKAAAKKEGKKKAHKAKAEKAATTAK